MKRPAQHADVRLITGKNEHPTITVELARRLCGYARLAEVQATDKFRQFRRDMERGPTIAQQLARLDDALKTHRRHPRDPVSSRQLQAAYWRLAVQYWGHEPRLIVRGSLSSSLPAVCAPVSSGPLRSTRKDTRLLT
jgi:hypothetical protein